MTRERNQVRKNVPGGSIPFGTVTGTYASPAPLNTLDNIVQIEIRNRTDQPIQLSLDGGTTLWKDLNAGEYSSSDLGCNGVQFSGNISIRYTSSLGASGSVAVSFLSSK